jgi:hypothetical protein
MLNFGKNPKTKRFQLYVSDSRIVTFDLGLESEIGVSAEAVLTCT